MIRRLLLGLLGALAISGAAHATCPTPNPNVTAPPFYDGCPLPAAALNNLASMTGRSLLSFGVVANGTTDNSTAITAATAWAAAQGAKGAALLVPPGVIYSTTTMALTMPSAGSHVSIRGAGKGVSQLLFAAGVGGIDIAFYNAAIGQAFDIEDLSLVTKDTTNTYAAIYAHATTAYYTPQSVVRNVMTIGNGFDPVSRGATTVWGTGVKLYNISDVAIETTDLYGNDTTTPTGTGVSAVATSVTGSLTIQALNTHGLDISISIGNNVQGVQVANSNLEGTVGINVAGSVTGLTELNVSGVSFNLAGVNNSTGISLNSKLSGLTVTNSEFAYSTGFAGNVYGVSLTDVEGCSISSNAFQGQGTSTPTSTGVKINGPTTGGGCNVIGNYFEVLSKGIDLEGASITGGYASGNIFATTVTTPCTNGTSPVDTNYVLYGCYTPGQFYNTAVSAAVTDTAGTKLTVTSTTGFVTGDVVAWGGVAGITYPQGVGPIEVVDSTHMILLNAAFGGTYTSGGSVFLVP